MNSEEDRSPAKKPKTTNHNGDQQSRHGDAAAAAASSTTTLTSVRTTATTTTTPGVVVVTQKRNTPPPGASDDSAAANGSKKTGTNNAQDDEEMIQALSCSICCEIMHDSVAVQPCGHCFCAGCFSDWMVRNHRCPECRLKVKRASKNHRMNNLIEIYLQNHQDKKRPDEELRGLDAKNKITTDIYVLKKDTNTTNPASQDSSYSDEAASDSDDSSSLSEDDENDADDDPLSPNGNPRDHPKKPAAATTAGPSTTPLPLLSSILARPPNFPVHYSPMHVPVCAQCANYGSAPYNNVTGYLIRPPLRSDPPKFVCAPRQAHVLCFCCRTYLPDRRNDPNCADSPLECKICRKTFCHLYFGCSRYGCKGCLNKFKDFTFDQDIYRSVVNENIFETGILKTYLESKNIAWSDFFQQCMSKLDLDEFDCKDKRAFNVKSDSIICVTCALSNFRDLAYEYRKTIPVEGEASKRRNCWYGRNCRTQKTKLAHAEKLNHICEQTRF